MLRKLESQREWVGATKEGLEIQSSTASTSGSFEKGFAGAPLSVARSMIIGTSAVCCPWGERSLPFLSKGNDV
ncbi:Hypothetical predicted protein [Podarcis lilfordi]|uniref:Uncharacterized protein n=1 Tax=Podarcis lilfordi TaxID=74358 RepID=A0AA35NXI5_9SAUR|nr:Hypothetical predicted protein [Podarcis lilfordi]